MGQLSEVNRQVEDFLIGGSYPDIISNRQLHAVFGAFRTILTKSSSTAESENLKVDMSKSGKKVVNSAKSNPGRAKVEDKNSKKAEPESTRANTRKQKDETDKKSKNNEKKKKKKKKKKKQSNNTPIQSESVIMDLGEKNNDSTEQ